MLSYNLLMLPGVILLLIFAVMPMLGIVIAFQHFIPTKGIFGSEWVGLEEYKDQENVWVYCPLPLEGMKVNDDGTVSIQLTTNVLNHGNFTGSSVDLYVTFAEEELNSFLTQHQYCDEGWVGYSDRNINVRLELYNGKKWVAVAPAEETYYDEHTVLDQFANDGSWYNAGRNLILGDLSGYTDARMMVQLHVGDNLDVAESYTKEEFATFLETPAYGDNPVTGDSAVPLTMLILAVASAGAICLVARRRRRSRGTVL